MTAQLNFSYLPSSSPLPPTVRYYMVHDCPTVATSTLSHLAHGCPALLPTISFMTHDCPALLPTISYLVHDHPALLPTISYLVHDCTALGTVYSQLSGA